MKTLPEMYDELAAENAKLRAENEALKQSRKSTLQEALTAAFNLGSIYWQQADSESIRDNRKADETLARFNDLLDSTIAALAAKGE